MLYKIAPKSLVFFGILTITIVLFINIYTTLQTPALGIVWEPTQTGDLSIKQIFPNSPAQQAGLPIGQVIVSIGYSDLSEPISVLSITEEPDNLGKYHNAAQFFAHQSLVADIINQNTLWLEAKDGSRYTIQPAPRHFSWLPPMYWFQLACGLLSFFSGMLVFVFRMKDPAARVYLLNGISFTVVTFSAAIYSSRELAIPGDIFKVLSALNHLGSLCFTASFIALAWYIPKKLNDFSITSTLLLLYSLFWLADTFRWQTDSPETWVQLPILFGLFSSIIIATIQWRKCKQRHDDKQALRWLLLSLLVPGIVFLCLTIVLQWLGIELIVPQGYSFGVLLIMYLGISLGVIRFALFELDKWWASIWLWLFTGIFFIAVDILLATTLHLSETTSTLLSLVIIGFIYIPVRQKIFLRIPPSVRVVGTFSKKVSSLKVGHS